MSTVNDVFAQALALPMPERAALAKQLLHSLDPEDPDLEAEDPDVEEAWEKEILARSDAVHRGDYTARDWREALDEIRKQLPRSVRQNREAAHETRDSPPQLEALPI